MQITGAFFAGEESQKYLGKFMFFLHTAQVKIWVLKISVKILLILNS